jgi:hypothetical protein
MKKKMTSSRGDALQKLDHPHTHMSRWPDANAGSRGLLSQLSMRAED